MSNDSEKSKSAKIIQLRPRAATRASERKWGGSVMGLGFCIIPSLLLKAQRRLGLTPTQLAVVMHLVDYWWDAERKPYPSKATLGERLKLGPRQVQRHIAELEAMGLVHRIQRYAVHGGKVSNTYDLAGLVKRLKELEPEFRQVEDEARARRKAVARPGLRRRQKKKVEA